MKQSDSGKRWQHPMPDDDGGEEFAAGSKYDEILQKCYLCGRMITSGVLLYQVQGSTEEFDSQQCIEDLKRYRLPYIGQRGRE